jgi:uncharacterized protein (DUF305 family)
MRPSSGYALSAVLLALAACTPQAMPTPAPARAGSASAAVRADTQRTAYSAADVRFMQGMIGHHAQALAMTELLSSRTARDDMRLLAERITVSQRTEIAMMQRWLRERGEAVPDSEQVRQMAMGHGMAGHDMPGMPGMPGMSGGAPAMPGMASAEEMARLAAAQGTAFDRLFLQLMIRHHEGAIAMVRALFASPGAGQESEMYRFASDVDADQRAEIARMRALLGAIPPQ